MGNGWIACPIHGARFDLVSGKTMKPPAKRPIATYAVRIVDGWIESKSERRSSFGDVCGKQAKLTRGDAIA